MSVKAEKVLWCCYGLQKTQLVESALPFMLSDGRCCERIWSAGRAPVNAVVQKNPAQFTRTHKLYLKNLNLLQIWQKQTVMINLGIEQSAAILATFCPKHGHNRWHWLCQLKNWWKGIFHPVGLASGIYHHRVTWNIGRVQRKHTLGVSEKLRAIR